MQLKTTHFKRQYTKMKIDKNRNEAKQMKKKIKTGRRPFHSQYCTWDELVNSKDRERKNGKHKRSGVHQTVHMYYHKLQIMC